MYEKSVIKVHNQVFYIQNATLRGHVETPLNKKHLFANFMV